jgi:ActR/RegA family two-component response regulator
MRTVLLVEDNVTLAYFAARNLRQAIGGVEVAIARSCSEAESKAALLVPSVLVVDVELADGNGVELAVGLTARLPGLTTIVTSGREPAGLEDVNVYGFLTKPYEAEALIDMVKRAVFTEDHAAVPAPAPILREADNIGRPGVDRHSIKNKLGSLLVGLRALQGDLIAGSENPDEVRGIARSQIEGLCDRVKEVSELLNGGSGREFVR